MDRTRKIAAAALATGVLAVGALVPAAARESDADTETDTGTDRDPVDTTDTTAAADVADEWRAAQHAAFAEALAEELDLDPDTLARAIDAVRDRLRTESQEQRRAALERRLAEAVEEGALSQEQADAIEDAHDDGVLRFRDGRTGREGRGMVHHLDRDDLRGLGRGRGRHGWGADHGPGMHGGPFGAWDPEDDPEPAA